MAFEEFSALAGQDVRKVEFDVPKADLECLRQVPDLKGFDPQKASLFMLKTTHGLKDAPRAWRKHLHQVLIRCMSRRPFHSELDFYCVHRKDEVEQQNIYKRAQEHHEEQLEKGNFRNTMPQAYVPGNRQCLSSVHVDDIKGTARKATVGPSLRHPNEKV